MKNIKKLFLFILNCTLAVCMGVLLVGCSCKEDKPQDDKPKKYDVAIKVVCREVNDRGLFTGNILDEVIFTLDKDEISIERANIGRSRKCRYYVIQYNMPNHPTLSEEWLTPNNSGGHETFLSSLLYREAGYTESNATTGWQKIIKDKIISEPGEYVYNFETYLERTWNRRSCDLYITVK